MGGAGEAFFSRQTRPPNVLLLLLLLLLLMNNLWRCSSSNGRPTCCILLLKYGQYCGEEGGGAMHACFVFRPGMNKIQGGDSLAVTCLPPSPHSLCMTNESPPPKFAREIRFLAKAESASKKVFDLTPLTLASWGGSQDFEGDSLKKRG